MRAANAGHAKVILTDITDREVQNRIRERVNGAIAQSAKHHILYVTSIVDFKAVLETLTSGACADIVSQWRDYITNTGAEILRTDELKAGPVLEAFFNKRPPFSHKKPGEFRDAFTIERMS
jgi:hypothetical protein